MLSGQETLRPVLLACLVSLVFLIACGHKDEHETKSESKPEAKADTKTEKSEAKHGEGDAKKGGAPEVKSPVIVAHLRIELNRETSDEKIPAISPLSEEAPKIAVKEKKGAEHVSASPSLTQDMAFKTDKEYLALRRFDLPVPKEEKKAEKSAGEKEERDAIDLRQKLLVLGGKGSDIQGFRSKSSDSMGVDSTSRLEEPLPDTPVRKERAVIDLKEGNIKNKRSLIFHQQGSGFFKVDEPEQQTGSSNVVQPKAKSPTLEKIPETKLLFSQGKESQITLQPGGKEIDLLLGNEEYNRKDYESQLKPVK